MMGTHKQLLTERQALVRKAKGRVVSAVILAVFIGLVTAALVSQSILGPILRLKNAAAEIGEGKLDARLAIKSKDEIGALAVSFNKMAADLKYFMQKERELAAAAAAAKADHKRAAELEHAYKEIQKKAHELKEATAQLVQNEKMTALGELSAGIAHELNQPLNGIRIICQDILRDIDKNRFNQDALANDLKEVVGQVQRMSGIIDHMRLFSRHSIGNETAEVDVNEAVEGVFKLLGQQLRVHNIEVRKELTHDLPKLLIDPVRLEQVFVNIINNARDALGRFKKDGMVIEIKSYLQQAGDAKKVVLSIKDNGGGIAKDIRNKIFEPFFTTKRPGEGTGLGLSVSRKIISDAGGRIELEVEEGKGSTFKVILPAAEHAEKQLIACVETEDNHHRRQSS